MQSSKSFEIINPSGTRSSIIEMSYHPKSLHGLQQKALAIACAGGFGHITAIEAYMNTIPRECVTYYTPKQYEDHEFGGMRASIRLSSYLNQLTMLSSTIDTLRLPVIPSPGKLTRAIQELQSNWPRPYVDMLLDVYPTGYESAAIWNINQREDNKPELTKLVNLQTINDRYFYQHVYDYYWKLLEESYHKTKPYTEIISTQAIGLAALCDVVNHYNSNHTEQDLIIHQYMTDLATVGAVHFFKVLARLKPEQQRQMRLYAVGLNDVVLDHFFPMGHHFDGIYNIPPKKNLLIRRPFIQNEYDNSPRFKQNITVVSGEGITFDIRSGEKIAAIMLGGQAGNDTTRYITQLIDHGMDRVFVFGGTNAVIREKVSSLQRYADKIVLLNKQDAPFIASLKSRCQVIVMRAGGLSVMEELAMNHHPEQIILLHHADMGIDLKSGIPWEDCNADMLITLLAEKNIRVVKVCPSTADETLAELLSTNVTDDQWLRI